MSGLRFRIALFAFLLSAIPILVVGLVLSQSGQASRQQQSQELQRALAERVRVEIDGYLEQRLQGLHVLERTSLLPLLDDEALKAKLELLMVGGQFYQELALYDRQGLLHWVSRTVAGAESAPSISATAVDHGFEQGGDFIGEPRFDPELREPLLDVAIAVTDKRSGEARFVLAAAVRLKPVWDLLAGLDLPAGTDAYVVDESGRILVHKNPSTVLANTHIDEALASAYAEAPLRVNRPLRLDDDTASVVVVRSAPVAYRLVGEIRWLVLALIVGALAVSALLGILMARRLSRPIERLVSVAAEVADGRFDIRLDRRGPAEIRALGEALESMATRLGEQFRRLEDAEFSARELAQVTIESIGDGVITTDRAGRIVYLNPVAEQLTGWSVDSARDLPLEKVFHIVNEVTRETAPNPVARALAEGRVQGLANHTVLISKDGRECAIQDSVAPIRGASGEMLGAVMVFSDVTEARKLEREISHQATHDSLTNLVNRQEFERRLRRVLDGMRDSDTRHGLCYLDLDQFKIVNDTCGHTAGDELLRQVSSLLLSHVRNRDTLGRIGGDEFVVLMEHCDSEHAVRVAEQLRQSVEAYRFHWDGRIFSIGVSIGVVEINRYSHNFVAVLQAADNACYLAKEAGRNRVNVYRDDDQAMALRRAEMDRVTMLKQALEEDRFELHAQAIDNLGSKPGHPQHFELLLRLLDTDGNRVLPSVFLRAAERYDLMIAIDHWVIEHTLDWLGRQTEFPDSALWGINLSGQTLGDEDFLDYVLDRFQDCGTNCAQICFEVTETAAIGNLGHARKFIQTVRERGCKVALDDFGSGLSSFAYLKALPVDFLKIDGAFIRDVVSDDVDLAMVRSINEIGHLLGMRTVAECVESPAILERVRELGVDAAQGTAVGQPEPVVVPPFRSVRRQRVQ